MGLAPVIDYSLGAFQLSMLERTAAVYVRVAGDVEPGSLEKQEAEVRRYVDNLGLDVYEVYRDEGVAANVPMEDRPGGKRLLEDARRGVFSHVVVYDLDRVARDVQTLGWLIGTLDEVRVMLHSVQRPGHLMVEPLKILPGGGKTRNRRKGGGEGGGH